MLLLLPSLLLLSGCNTVKVTEQRESRAIIAQRGNIVTENTLSTQTASSLISYGIDSRACLVNFNICLDQIEEVTLLKPKRDVFALLAELYYAKAQQIGNAGTCQTSLQRLPIDPYYPNAYSSTGFIAQKQIIDKACQNTYLSYLVSSIRYSYAYMFYHSLENDFEDDFTRDPNIQFIVTDISIQTKDIYNAATSRLVKILYEAQEDNFALLDTVSLLGETLNPQQLAQAHNLSNSASDNSAPDSSAPDSSAPDSSASDSSASDSSASDSSADQISDYVLSATTNLPDSNHATEPTTATATNSIDLDLNPKHHSQIEVLRLRLSHTPFGSVDRPIHNPVDDGQTPTEPVQSLQNHALATTTVSVYLPDETDYLHALPTPYSEAIGRVATDNTSKTGLYSSYDLNYTGLKSVSKREGFGVSFVTLLSNRQTTSITDFITSNSDTLNKETPKSRIYRTGNLLLTGVVIPEGNSIKEVLNGKKINIKLYNPRHVDHTKILGQDYSLKANFSASYGLWLSENSLSGVGYLNLLSRQQKMVLPQLFLLEPYDPNKRVVIMVHGLASSPATWVGITNDILNDDRLRESYQVWQVFYPTQVPILENRYQIQKLIETAFNEVDPNSQDVASQHSVIVSHSMGAVISRMMLSNDDLNDRLSQLDEMDNDGELSRLIRQSYADQNIDARLKLNKLAPVDKAVFISAPFRGTDYADKWFTRALRRIVQLPLGFIQTVTGNLTNIATQGELVANPLGALYLQNGASQLSDQSSFVKLTEAVQIDPHVTYHSIIANNDPDIAQGLAALANTEAKIDLSEYRPSTDDYDDPYRPDSIPLSDLNIDAQAFEELNTQAGDTIHNITTYTVQDTLSDRDIAEVADNPKPTRSAPTQTNTQSVNANSSALIATVNVHGELDPSIAHSITDGIVPYTSAHLEGAKSETIISGGHGIQDTPQAILLLRTLLREHLDQHPISATAQHNEDKTP